MAVIEQTPISNFTGNGVTTVFAFDFLVPLNTDLLVIVDGVTQALGTDYTVAGTGVSSGGTVTFTTAPASGVAVSVVRDIPATRSTDYQENGDLLADVLNDDFDRIVLMVQDATAVVGVRAVRGPVGESLVDLPPAASRANTTLGFDSNGQPTVLTPDSGSAADVLTRLADATDVAKGAALVAFRPTLNYVVATMGHALEYSGVTPSMFSHAGTVDPTGVADSTTALLAWAASPFPKLGEPGTFKLTQTLSFATNSPIDFRGMRLDASAGGTWTSAAVVLFAGSISAMPALSANVVRDQQVLATAAAHTLDEGDVFCIYNPTDGSWSSIRAYYREGEFCKVARVTSTTGLVLLNPLYSDYLTASVNLYKLARAEVEISNLSVIGPAASAVVGVKTTLCTRVRMRNVHVPDGNYCGIYFDRCYDIETHGCNTMIGVTAVTDAYGLLVGNSQEVRVFGGMLYGKRAGFDIGGDDFTCAVPSRGVQLINATTDNERTSNFPSCDLHGNLEGFKAIGSRIRGGASWAGVHNEYIDCDFEDAPAGVGALIVGGSEWLGGTARVSGGSMRASQQFKVGATEYAVVRIVTNAAAKQDTNLIVENVEADIGPNKIFVLSEMAPTATKKASFRVTDIAFTSAATMNTVLRAQGTGAGGDGNWVIVDRISGGPAGTFLYIAASGYGAATLARLMMQRGISSVTSVIGAAASSTATTFGYSYGSKVPSVNTSQQERLVGALVIASMPRLVNSSTFQADIYTTGGANFAAATAVDVSWSAGVSEV